MAQRQLLFHLRARAVHQHDLHAHRVQQRHVVDQRVKHARLDQFARERDHEGLAAEGMDIRRHHAQPIHELLVVGAAAFDGVGGRRLRCGGGLGGSRGRRGEFGRGGRLRRSGGCGVGGGRRLRRIGSGVHPADYNPGQCQNNAPSRLQSPPGQVNPPPRRRRMVPASPRHPIRPGCPKDRSRARPGARPGYPQDARSPLSPVRPANPANARRAARARSARRGRHARSIHCRRSHSPRPCRSRPAARRSPRRCWPARW
ncbi:hypothetical protein D9M69_491700 [compost metagenome]